MCHSKIICIILICKIYDKSEKILYVIWWIEEIIRKINTMIVKIAILSLLFTYYIITIINESTTIFRKISFKKRSQNFYAKDNTIKINSK